MARRNPNLPRAGTPTDTNLYVLDREFATLDTIPNRFPSVSVPHVRRCFAAGLIEATADRKSVKLTPRGVWVLKAYRANGAAQKYGVKHLTAEQTATLSDEISGRLDARKAAEAALAKLREIARTRRPTEEETAEANAVYAAAAVAA